MLDEPVVFGLMTDLHYADKPAAGTRHYRESLDKLDAAGEIFGSQQPTMIVELGDFIDAAPSVATELEYLRTVNRPFSMLGDDRHYVLGNHCVDTLTKEEFLGEVGQEKSYYSFDRGGIHFIILDACFRSDGLPYQRRNFDWTDTNIPQTEIDWLIGDLAATDLPTIVFIHQRLDVATVHGVKNNSRVRQVLEQDGGVLAVFQGHSHQNDLTEINGIYYCTMVAMVEGTGLDNNGFSLVKITRDGSIQIDGFRKQKDYRWDVAEERASDKR
jgi:alkaline phosphatase